MNKPINCIIVDDEKIARDIIASHLARIDSIHVLATCKNAVEAFNSISNHKIDLIFLDINMPEISGIAFAKSINKDVKIIFTTAYRDYAIEGFDLKAVDYLLKPIAFERLLKAVHHYFEIYNSTENDVLPLTEKNDFIFVRSQRRMLKVDFEDILFIESYSDYLKIHITSAKASNKRESVVTRETISAIEAKLPKTKFLRTHRSFIVNITKIKSYTHEALLIRDQMVPISRSYKKDVLNTLENL